MRKNACRRPTGPIFHIFSATLGVTGDMLPCPVAIVVLLSAVAFQCIALGLLLIVAFGLGPTAVLATTGLVCVSARGLLQRWDREGHW